MPWLESSALEQRTRFIEDHLTGHWTLAELCRRYGISRKTGYKWVGRHESLGDDGLVALSRAPKSCPHRLPGDLVARIVALRSAHPTWGPKKLRALLMAEAPPYGVPATSTVGAVLERYGLVVPRKRRRGPPLRETPLTEPGHPNHVWSADYKGDFQTRDGVRCYPLTISDAHSRFLLRCQGMTNPRAPETARIFLSTFREYGLPDFMRTDNGPPFAGSGAGGLSKLAVWFIKLGVKPERIQMGHPEQNGRHERMHRTLKEEAISPPKHNLGAQQRAFNQFRREYNEQRPHESLGQKPPATAYTPSPRPYPRRVPSIEYAEDAIVRKITPSGILKWRDQRIWVSESLIGEYVELKAVEEELWMVRFSDVELGLIDGRCLDAGMLRKPIAPTRPRGKQL